MSAIALMLAWASVATPADGRRDPLRPPGHERERGEARFNANAWELASTLVAGDRRIARVNGRTVRPGDMVGGARVLEIDNGRVRLDYRGRAFTIRRRVPDVRHEHGS